MSERVVRAIYTDVMGEIFNEHVAIMYLFSDKQRHDYWLFKCPFCKSLYIARLDSVKGGHTKSCGCLKNFYWHLQMELIQPKNNAKNVPEIKKDFINRVIQHISKNNSTYKFAIASIFKDFELYELDEMRKTQRLERIVQLYLKESYNGYSSLQKILS